MKRAVECFAEGGDHPQATEILLVLLKEKPDNLSARTAVQIVLKSGDSLKLLQLLNLFADSSPRRLAEATKAIDSQALTELKTSHPDKWKELCDKVQPLIVDPHENFNDPSGETKEYMRGVYQTP